MSKNWYYDIYTIDDYFWEDDNRQFRVNTKHKSIHNYCYNGINSSFDNSRKYLEMTKCSVIYLLKMLKENYKLEDDKLAEYAILFLSYKLKQHSQHKFIKLNDFYTNHIKNNNDYNKNIKDNGPTYKEIIDRKKNLMDIKEISKFNDPFVILFYLYYVFYDEYLNCTYNSNLAKRFAKEFEELSKDSKNIEESLYNKILSTLSDDYNKLKNIYGNKKSCNFIALPIIEPKKKPSENLAQNPVENRVEGSGKNSLENSVQHTALSPAEKFGQISLQPPEVISSSSSISTTLIPALSIVSAIPVFLGIAYKTIFKKKIKKSKDENET
ncbi:PIR protein CIR protein [Plasmodium vinckei vinckei]|uniref:PIR protein CIR protein n=1 Tax=Plasmodium vinckei vinckei TaxID=54757 RepID=A0A449BUL5_PLAVN|nr:PIR protein CIR protein [Plasmodium vinckei vinckei]VEV57134.1 PIR protein CIR protein [Plasmodium vinckei vinckei]